MRIRMSRHSITGSARETGLELHRALPSRPAARTNKRQLAGKLPVVATGQRTKTAFADSSRSSTRKQSKLTYSRHVVQVLCPDYFRLTRQPEIGQGGQVAI